jgi:Holliday junction resolvase
MIKTYRKGYRAERELLRFLSSRGYSVLRQASSGGSHSPVDVVAMKVGKILSFEIKAWSEKPRLSRKQLQAFKKWSDNAGALSFLAWYNQNKWRFLPLSDAEKGNYEDENWLKLEDFFKIFL